MSRSENLKLIRTYREHALAGYPYAEECSISIAPLVNDFFRKTLNLKINWESTAGWEIKNISIIVIYLARKTSLSETIEATELDFIRKIFEEIDNLITETIHFKNSRRILDSKIKTLSCLIFKNTVVDSEMKKRKIFNFKNLYYIIHFFNTKWNKLYSIGMSSTKIEYFLELVEKQSEEERLMSFIKLIDA